MLTPDIIEEIEQNIKDIQIWSCESRARLARTFLKYAYTPNGIRDAGPNEILAELLEWLVRLRTQSAILAEREECAKIVEEYWRFGPALTEAKDDLVSRETRRLAKRIRARSQSAPHVLTIQDELPEVGQVPTVESEIVTFRSPLFKNPPLTITDQNSGREYFETSFPASILTNEDSRETESDMLASVGIRMQADSKRDKLEGFPNPPRLYGDPPKLRLDSIKEGLKSLFLDPSIVRPRPLE